MFKNYYSGKKVLITGHTGFKGSWLTSWLLRLGADVVGASKDVPTNPSMFEETRLAGRICHHQVDTRDLPAIHQLISDVRPDYVFHLAAQAIVSVSFADPVETFTTNTIGTMNILEALRRLNRPCVAVLITSDKCYDNVEWIWGYRETDSLGGKDVYSGSKAAAELVIKSYLHSFFHNEDNPVRLGIGRAGNVIGGGDWAKDRLVVDCMLAWNEGRTVEIRSPRSTRPWQHVLEPLSGYLTLGMALAEGNEHGAAFNFGPRAEHKHTVVELLGDLGGFWGLNNPEDAYRITDNIPFQEAGLLKLNCDKALYHLGWEPNLDYAETIRMVSEWYYAYYREKRDMYAFTQRQLSEYEQFAGERGRVWTRS